jgi:cytidine deaminase
MEKKCINISYTEYDSIDELGTSDKLLLEHAIAAADTSYAPYSSFNVGAAVQLSNGEIVSGSNQENAAYPSGLCAERTAIFYAHSKYPDAAVKAIALVAKQNGHLTESFTYPCGACRQVLHESQMRSGAPVRIIVGSATKVLVLDSVNGLLPFAFDNLI